jgi:phage terminase large subunit GpA-like protein
MPCDREMQRALELDGEKLRQLTGEDHGPFCPSCLGRREVGWFDHAEGAWRNEPCLDCSDQYPGQAPCPHCFESSGYVWEHGNDWNSGPWSVQTNIPCKHCNGTGIVDSPLATLDDLEGLAADEAEAQ